MTPFLIAPVLLLVASFPWLLRLLTPRSNPKRTTTQKPSTITSLRIYPIKSCRGIELSKSKLCTTGLDLDRRWMIVDAKTHVFLTIRQIPEMTCIRTALSDDGAELILSVVDPNGKRIGSEPEVRIPAHPDQAWLETHARLASDVKIWDTVTDGYIYSERVGVNQLFSRFLNQDVVLVYKGPTRRILKGNGDPRLLGREEHTNFPDVLPLLIASEASMNELNSRLTRQGHAPITIERFRPNIIIRGDGAAPWAEDSWKTVRISSAAGSSAGDDSMEEGKSTSKSMTVDIVARCGRCQVPNVDPDSAEKHKTQPWDTMMGYRRVDEGLKYKPCFGMLGVPRGEGEVGVGMQFEVLEETDKHRYVKGF
ncbi:hypothetical protein BJX61DRAFT_527495 [Aspergillus egyptiacus]|nr:hypothetical protein BJX61DRAFT_527495 [Aspergillus egyptiacus]